MKQKFYCKECNKEFEVESDESYYNYKCPDCGIISLPKDYTRIRFKGLSTVRG